MNEGAGSLTYDVSGHKNHGTLKNMLPNVQGSKWQGSKFGGGLDFDGVNDYVSISPDIYLDSSFSLCGWVNVTAWDDDNAQIIGRLEATNWFQNYYLNLKTANNQFQVGFYDTNGSAWREIQSNTGKSAGEWFFVVGTWDTSDDKLRIYVNGVLETTSAQFAGAIPSDAGTTEIGALTDSTPDRDHLNGKIDEVCIYNRALPAKEVKRLYYDPFCNLMQVPAWQFYSPAVGGLSIPVAMHQYEMLRA